MEKLRTLADRYELTAHIARGGMADVYQAADTLLGRQVAVKMLHAQYSSDDAFVKRFRREAQAAANLSHPSIVGIYDWGEDASTYFIVMELVEGRSLRDVLRTEGGLLPRRAAEIASEVAAALAVAHRAGLVHRDVKPGNILLAPDGAVKVTDFGIARAWDDSQELTRTGAVIGTATYFSPEQAQGLPADERSDIYSLGVVLYEMLTGRPPFQGDSPVAVAYQHVSAEVDAPSVANPDVPAELDQIVMRALHKNPDARYQTADDIRTDLLRVLKGESPAAVPAGEAPTQVLAPSLPPPTVPPDETYRRLAEETPSQLPFILTAFALLLTLGVAMFLLIRALAGSGAAADLVTIPDLAGATEADALFELQQLGFLVTKDIAASDTVAAGLVIGTQPPAGEQAEAGSFVTMIISAGKEAFPVPRVIGEPFEEARRLLETNGFVVGELTDESNDVVPEGTVIDQDPAPGTTLPPGTEVNLVVSTGAESVLLEDLAGRSEREVAFLLGQLGLLMEAREEFSRTVEEGFVVRTEPEPGAVLPRGATVIVFVSKGPEPVTVPTLIGLTPQEAQARLDAVRLVLRVSAATVPTDASLWGKVAAQVPDTGTEVEPGTVVTVTLGAAPATTTTPPTTTLPPTTTTTVAS